MFKSCDVARGSKLYIFQLLKMLLALFSPTLRDYCYFLYTSLIILTGPQHDMIVQIFSLF